MTRRSELAAALDQVRRRIVTACVDAGRDPAEVTLIAVTKTYPASDAALLAELGVGDLGENRHPEAGEKFAALRETGLASRAGLPRCHFLGALQTNKAGAVARYADVVHSVDREKLVASLSRGAVAAGRSVEALVQVDLGPEFGRPSDGRSGASPTDVDSLADAIDRAAGLTLGGLMAVAPLEVDPRPVFERLVALAERVRDRHPGATTISAGMSGDLEQAVAAGATHLRVGRSILGERPTIG